MAARKTRNTDRSYLKGLLFDPILRGPWGINASSCHGQPRAGLFIRASLLWLLSIFSFIAFITCIILFLNDPQEKNFRLALSISFPVFTLSFLIAYIVRRSCTCPLCRGTSLLNGKNKKNQKACKLKPLSFAGTSMFSMLIRRRYRCPHCGTPFDLRKKR